LDTQRAHVYRTPDGRRAPRRHVPYHRKHRTAIPNYIPLVIVYILPLRRHFIENFLTNNDSIRFERKKKPESILTDSEREMWYFEIVDFRRSLLHETYDFKLRMLKLRQYLNTVFYYLWLKNVENRFIRFLNCYFYFVLLAVPPAKMI